jgi:hypothetical protein
MKDPLGPNLKLFFFHQADEIDAMPTTTVVFSGTSGSSSGLRKYG